MKRILFLAVSVWITVTSINGQTDSLSINKDKKLSTPDTIVPDYLYNKPKLENISPVTSPGITAPSTAFPEIDIPSPAIPEISAPSDRTGLPNLVPDTSGAPGIPGVSNPADTPVQPDSRDMTPAPTNPSLPDQTPLPD